MRAFSRREFFEAVGLGVAALGLGKVVGGCAGAHAWQEATGSFSAPRETSAFEATLDAFGARLRHRLAAWTEHGSDGARLRWGAGPYFDGIPEITGSDAVEMRLLVNGSPELRASTLEVAVRPGDALIWQWRPGTPPSAISAAEFHRWNPGYADDYERIIARRGR